MRHVQLRNDLPLSEQTPNYLSLHNHGRIHGTMLSVIESLTKENYVRVPHPHLPEDVEIDRGLTEGSALSPCLYSIFLRRLLHKLRAQFPGATCAGHQSPQWIGALAYMVAYMDDLCLCADSISELETMIFYVHE